MGEDDEIYEVEKILQSVVESGTELFLVKWVGYEDPTWEPLAHLDGCKEMLQAFRQEQRELAKKKAILRQKQTERLTKANQYWRFVASQGLAATSSGFLGTPRLDTSKLDSNWYVRPEPMTLDPGQDFQITGVVRKANGEKVVRLANENGVCDCTYETFAALFPDALQAFIEDKLSALPRSR